MNKDAFRLTSPSGTETELPVRSGTTGPDVIDVGKLYKERNGQPVLLLRRVFVRVRLVRIVRKDGAEV